MAQFGRAPALGAGCRRFESCHPDHVVADYVSFATTFLLKSHRLTHAVAPPFRKKSRLLRPFACKRPHNASAALPTFCGFESISKLFAGISFAISLQSRASTRKSRSGLFLCYGFALASIAGIFFVNVSHIGTGFCSFRFFCNKKSVARSTVPPFLQKVPLRLRCSLVNALWAFRLATNFLRV